MGDGPRRHCWECLRRCLVCDSERPACKRCTAAGNRCPGYSEIKPTRLRWLSPGIVKSRAPRRNTSESPSRPDEPGLLVPSHSNTDIVSIPRFGFNADFDALRHGAEYYNACIYPDLSPVQELGRNPFIYQVTPELIREAIASPDYLRLSVICMTLSHRMNRTRGDPGVNYRHLAQQFYKYRGDAIRSLREFLAIEDHCIADVSIAGIVGLLLADAQQAASHNWRSHVEGAIKLVQLRGGFAAVATHKILQPQLLFLCFVVVIGNTTCPASELSMTRAHLAELEVILELSDTAMTPFQLCPPPLFAETIKINHLRLRSAGCTSHGMGVRDQLAQEAYGILDRIHSFSPEQWAGTKPCSHQDWALMGSIYRAAVALYCISSLQSLSILPHSLALTAMCAADADLLQQSLAHAVTSPRTDRFTLWPLVVLGVQAVHNGREAMRDFVSAQLPVLSRQVGTYVPLTAKSVLETFWASGETSWDACFDRPYAFFTHLAVDTSRILTG